MRKDVEKCMRNAQTLKVMLEGANIKTMLNEVRGPAGGGRGAWCIAVLMKHILFRCLKHPTCKNATICLGRSATITMCECSDEKI